MAPYLACIEVQLCEDCRGRRICRRRSSPPEPPGCRRWRPTCGPSPFCTSGFCAQQQWVSYINVSERVCSALLVGVFKVALDDVHVNCTFSFQLKYYFSQNPSHKPLRHKKKRSPLPVLICFLAFPPWRLAWDRSSLMIWLLPCDHPWHMRLAPGSSDDLSLTNMLSGRAHYRHKVHLREGVKDPFWCT